MTSASTATARALLVFAACIAGCAPARSTARPANGATVTGEDLRNSNEPVEVVLQRKVPGLIVTRTTTGEIALNIRGATSLSGGDTSPLYILDGVPFHPGSGGVLTGVNPIDIESVKVLKGAEAGIYGIDGANGVIVITTKRAGRDVDLRLDVAARRLAGDHATERSRW